MTVPNIITIARLLMVPVLIVMILQERWFAAFLIFVVAGLSDAVDGFLARRFHMGSALGATLDPIADKALLVTTFVALALDGAVPAWLAMVVVGRDALILGAVAMSRMRERSVDIRPSFLGKASTAAQIGLAALALGGKAFDTDFGGWESWAAALVAALTVASGGAYLEGWLRGRAA
jgi:cardiolipin synthase